MEETALRNRRSRQRPLKCNQQWIFSRNHKDEEIKTSCITKKDERYVGRSTWTKMRFYGQLQQDKILYDNFFKYNPLINEGIAIEAGATNGVWLSNCKFFEENLGWKTINVEPNPVKFKELVENRPNSINVNKALSNEPNQNLFLRHGPRYFLRAHVTKNPKHTPVTTTTYSEIVKDYNLPHVTFFSLDVEGYELKVLENMLTCPENILPDVICVEYNKIGRKRIRAMMPDIYKQILSRSRQDVFYAKKTFLNEIKQKQSSVEEKQGLDNKTEE
jgi:FkbM family methyltransferase